MRFPIRRVHSYNKHASLAQRAAWIISSKNSVAQMPTQWIFKGEWWAVNNGCVEQREKNVGDVCIRIKQAKSKRKASEVGKNKKNSNNNGPTSNNQRNQVSAAMSSTFISVESNEQRALLTIIEARTLWAQKLPVFCFTQPPWFLVIIHIVVVVAAVTLWILRAPAHYQWGKQAYKEK